jgi:hypothetical protein
MSAVERPNYEETDNQWGEYLEKFFHDYVLETSQAAFQKLERITQGKERANYDTIRILCNELNEWIDMLGVTEKKPPYFIPHKDLTVTRSYDLDALPPYQEKNPNDNG